jgi:hypothetical protein
MSFASYSSAVIAHGFGIESRILDEGINGRAVGWMRASRKAEQCRFGIKPKL